MGCGKSIFRRSKQWTSWPKKGAVHYFFRSTLWKVEAGNPVVAMGIYAAVLHDLNFRVYK